MIYIGYSDAEKRPIIGRYCAEYDIRKTVVISADKFPLKYERSDNVTLTDVIEYVTFYRLLQEINNQTLIVLSECLRLQNRYDLHYNCIRNYLNQTTHCLVFQQLPQIDTREDFMILFDFVTGSRWKRRGWDIDLVLDNTQIHIRPLPITFNRVNVPTSSATKKKYSHEKMRRFAELGVRDPHTVPRNLYLIGGKDKQSYIDKQSTSQMSLFGGHGNGHKLYVARNKRLKQSCVVTYKDVEPMTYTIIEFPHRFIEFSDFIKRTGQTTFDVLLADLKVDHWYFERYRQWRCRIHETYSSLQQ